MVRSAKAKRVVVRPAISARTLLAAARRHFGIEEFRPGQLPLIRAALEGRNALGILPTGAGKSLCFQLPALFLSRTVLVVSPLISLMQDQMAHLDAARVPAVRLDSTVSAMEQAAHEETIRSGSSRIVLMSPERLGSPEHVQPLRGQVDLVVIDEAHCISQWGHDFRPAYLHLREAIACLGNPPVLALTATAPPALREDIQAALGLRHLDVVQTSMERPNLFLRVVHTVNQQEKEVRLLEAARSAHGSAIIYVSTVKEVDRLHAWLNDNGVVADKYHGRMPKKLRQETQHRFMQDESRIMVATNAFGLGIDKSSVRLVAHWNFPGSLESYYQEAGRAGRDGEDAQCTLLYQLEDKRIRSFFLGSNKPHERDIRAVLSAFEGDGQDRGLSLKEIANSSGLSVRRVSILMANLLELNVLERRGRRIYGGESLQDQSLESLVEELSGQFAADRQRLETMMRYAESGGCRMQFLREYFGEDAGTQCRHCDNCLNPPQLSQAAVLAR